MEFIDDEIEDVLHSTTSVMELSNTELSSTSVLDCNSEQTNTAILNARETRYTLYSIPGTCTLYSIGPGFKPRSGLGIHFQFHV